MLQRLFKVTSSSSEHDQEEQSVCCSHSESESSSLGPPPQKVRRRRLLLASSSDSRDVGSDTRDSRDSSPNDPNAWDWGSSCSDDDDDDDFHNLFGDGDGEGSDADRNGQDELDEFMRRTARQQRTAKARAASIAAFARRRLAKQTGIDTRKRHAAESYRKDVQPTSDINKPGGPHSSRQRRLRLLFSYLKSWRKGVMSFFDQLPKNKEVHHTLTCSIADDTNMRLASVVLREWKLSRTVSVMNQIQTLTCSYGAVDSPEPRSHKTFWVHTPLVSLPKTDQQTLCAEMGSRLMFFLGEVSSRFAAFGIAASAATSARIQGFSLCMDSLVTNVAVLKHFRTAVHGKHLESQRLESRDRIVFPMLGVFCLLHQLALSRKVLLTGFSGFFSSVVRLAHLMEVESFRIQFRKALVAVIYDSYQYAPVAEKPPAYRQWLAQRNEICGLMTDRSGRWNRKRLSLHRSAALWDNGNPEGDHFTHWCEGDCCEGTTHEQKAQYSLLKIRKFFTLLFSFGYPVPLLYRWVHAHRALQFVREPCYNII